MLHCTFCFSRKPGKQSELKNKLANNSIDIAEITLHVGPGTFLPVEVTDISKEGSLSGPSLKLYKEIMKRFPNFSIYAGGGVRDLDDLKRLSDLGIYGTIIGKAYYEGMLR